GLVEQALLERLAGLERDLAPHDLGIDLVEAADRDGSEDGRRSRVDAIADGRSVVAHVDPGALLDGHARVPALAKPVAQHRAAALVPGLLEDVAGLEREEVPEQRLVVGREGDALDVEVDVGHADRGAFLDRHRDVHDVALLRDLDAARHDGVVESAAAVEHADVVQVGAEGVRIERRALLPEHEPAPRPGDESVAQRAAADLMGAFEAELAQPPGALGIERLERDLAGGAGGEEERREAQAQHFAPRPGPHAPVVTARTRSARTRLLGDPAPRGHAPGSSARPSWATRAPAPSMVRAVPKTWKSGRWSTTATRCSANHLA